MELSSDNIYKKMVKVKCEKVMLYIFLNWPWLMALRQFQGVLS